MRRNSWFLPFAVVAGLALAPGVARAQTLFSETFEGGALGAYVETDLAGLPAATLWHGEGSCDGISAIPASMGLNAAAYNQGDLLLYNFNTGGANSGALESPVIAGSALAPVLLVFDQLRAAEVGGAFDISTLEIRPAAGAYAIAADLSSVLAGCPTTVIGTADVTAVSGAAWQHRFAFNTVDGIGNNYTGWYVDNVSARVAGPPCVIFAENFESGATGVYTETDLAGAAAPTLWHGEATCDGLTPIDATMGTNAAAYNQGDLALYNFNTGGANEGALESPLIVSSSRAALSLTFDHARDAETGGTFDVTYVEARAFAGAYGLIGDVSNTVLPCPGTTTVTMPVSGVPGGVWQHRFVFDTVDGVGNNYSGWYVDNISVSQNSLGGGHASLPTGCGAPAPSLAAAPDPSLGATVTYTMSGFVGIPILWLGFPAAFPLCPAGCSLGATLDVVVPGPVLSGTVPCDTTLIGGAIRVQGADLLAPGGCAIPLVFTITDTIESTIG